MDTIVDNIELASAAASPATQAEIPRCDGGIAAWRLLASAFVFETLLWGFPLSYGVFQEYYSRLPQFEGNPFVGVVGTIASGIAYIAAPVIIPLVGRYARYRRPMILVGWPLCILGLVAGSFADNLAVLIMTQGVMYGLGFSIFYYPIISMVNEFWVEKRGMAYGILCSASGLAGAAMPFALQVSLQKFGYQTTLRAIAVSLAVLTGPLIPLLKGRFPEANVSRMSSTDWSFVRHAPFWIYNISNFAMGLGYFFPSLYLPSYAVANGLSPLQGALLLAIMSISQVAGQVSFGYFSDRRASIEVLTSTSSLVAAVAILACWGLAKNFAPMAVFAILYGFFASGYTATWGRIATATCNDNEAAFAAFGFLNLGKGVGNVLTGPIGGVLIAESAIRKSVYGTGQYERVVLFTGACMLISGGIIVAYQAQRLKSS